jgi:hypothetical protein
MHTHFDPHRPMRHLISTVTADLLRDDPDYEESPATLPPVFRRMHQEFLRFPEHGARTPSLVDFLHHLRQLDSSYPTEGDLEDAPELCRWALVRRPASAFCQLTGYAAAHPRFEWGTPIVTSSVFQVDREFRWARTWSRFYLLNEYDIESARRMKADGIISYDAELVDFG